MEDYKKLGGKVVADEGFRDTDVDFRAQLTKVKSSGADILFLPGMGKDMTILIVEQNARKALLLSNRAYVLQTGKITQQGDSKELLHDPGIQAAYLGAGKKKQ